MATTTTSASPTTTTSGLGIPPSSSQPIKLSRDAIIWLVILGIGALAGISIALYYLLRHSCTKASRKRGHHVDDRRNEHKQWWKHANPPLGDDGDGDGDGGSNVEFATLTRHVDGGPGINGSWPVGEFGATHEGQSGGMKSRYYTASGQHDVKVEKMVV